MKDNRLKGIVALVIVTIVAFAIIYGSKLLVNDDKDNDNNDNVQEGGLDVTGFEGVDSAWEIKNDSSEVIGYAVKASARGFAGQVLLQVDFELDGNTIMKLTPVSHNETEGYGSKMDEEEFLSQFVGMVAPVSLAGDQALDISKELIKPASIDGKDLSDGIYSAQTDDFIGGYKFMVTMKVEDGKITSLVWDAMDELGQWKSYLSSTGQYVMSDDGLTWKQQADKLADFVISNQSITSINIDDEGHTDSISGVSISINEFVSLVKETLEEAAGSEPSDNKTDDTKTEGGSEIDAISGATASSNAIRDAINRAHAFISDYVNK